MTRSTAREIAIRLCFAVSENPSDPGELLSRVFDAEYYLSFAEEDDIYSELPSKNQIAYISQIVLGVFDHGAELDGYIDKYSVGWRFGRISRTAVAIMRVAMFEVLYMPDVPDSAAINDAVKIAKKYDPPETVSFLNGVLGSFVRAEKDELEDRVER
jgi:N utilization substance protein B